MPSAERAVDLALFHGSHCFARLGSKPPRCDLDAAVGEVDCVEAAVTVNKYNGEAGIAGSSCSFDGDDGIDRGSSRTGRDANGAVRCHGYVSVWSRVVKS
jgi:hypothetical protein